MTGPWSWRDDLSRCRLDLLGLVVLVGAWYASSGSTSPDRQVTSVAVGIGALALSAVAESLWLLTGLRAVRDRKQALCTQLDLLLQAADDLHTRPDASVTSAMPGRFVAHPRGRYFHLSDCSAAVGKGFTSGARGAQERAGRQPCGMCQP